MLLWNWKKRKEKKEKKKENPYHNDAYSAARKLNIENRCIVIKITSNLHSIYYITQIKQQNRQVEIRIDDCMELFQLRTRTMK